MLSNFLYAKLVWMPSFMHSIYYSYYTVLYIYYMQNCVSLFLVPRLLHCNGNLLAYVAALIVASVRKSSRARSYMAINLMVVGSISPQ